MTQAQGSKGYIALQKETTFGVTPVTPDLIKIPFSSESLNRSVSLETNDSITGARNPRQPVRGNTEVSGSISLNLGFYPGNILFAALGSDTYATATHTIKVGTTLPSFTIEKGFSDIGQYFLYKGCKVSKFGLTVASSGFQKCSLDIMGASETQSGTTFDASLTDLGDSPLDGFLISSIKEGSTLATITGVTELSINIDNGLDGDTFTIGGLGTRGAINEGMVAVSGSIKGFFENLTMLTKAINQTKSGLEITFTKGTGAGTSGNELLTITIPELVYSVKSPAISGPKGIYYELDWQAFWSADAANSACVMSLKNTQAVVFSA